MVFQLQTVCYGRLIHFFNGLHCRQLKGKELMGLNLKDLQCLEHQLHEGMLSVKDRKVMGSS